MSIEIIIKYWRNCLVDAASTDTDPGRLKELTNRAKTGAPISANPFSATYLAASEISRVSSAPIA